MSDTEIERMVVRLLGDGSAYVKMLNDAVGHTEEAAKSIEKGAEKIEGFQHKIEEFGEKAEKALLKIGVAVGLFEAFEKFEHAEKTLIGLESTLQRNGVEVEHTIEQYKKFAAQMQETTNTGKGVTLQLLSIAGSYSATGKAAQEATKDALALAAATGHSAEEMIAFSIAMSRGDTEKAERFTREIKQLRGVKDETELYKKYNELLAEGMTRLSKEMDTVGGKIEHMKQQLGSITKDVGQMVSEAVMPLVNALAGAVSAFNELDPRVRHVTIGTLAAIGAIGPLAKAYEYALVVIGRVAPVFNAANVAIVMTAQATLNFVRVSAGFGVLSTLGTVVDIFTGKLKAMYAAMTASAAGIAGVATAIAGAFIAVGGEIAFWGKGNAAIKQFNESMKENIELSNRRARLVSVGEIKESARISHVSDDLERREELEKQLKKAEMNEHGLASALEHAKKQLESEEGAGHAVQRNIPYLGTGANQSHELAKANVAELEKAYQAAEQRTSQLHQTLAGIPTSQELIEQKTGEMNRAWNDSLKYIGLNSDEVDILKLKVHGLTQEQEKALKAKMDSTFNAKSIEEATQALDKQEKTIGMTDDEIKVYELSTKHATQAQQDMFESILMETAAAKKQSDAILALKKEVEGYIDTIDDEIAVLGLDEDTKKQLKVMNSDLTESQKKLYNEKVRTKRATQDEIDLNAKVAETTKQFLTPLEEYTARIKELDQQKGKLTPETYARALEAAAKKFEEATGAARQFGTEVNKLDGTLANSADAMAKQIAYSDFLHGSQQTTVRAPVQANLQVPGVDQTSGLGVFNQGDNKNRGADILKALYDIRDGIRNQKNVKVQPVS